MPFVDPIASVVICGQYLKSRFGHFRVESINKMVDHSCDNTTETKIRELVRSTAKGLRVLTI